MNLYANKIKRAQQQSNAAHLSSFVLIDLSECAAMEHELSDGPAMRRLLDEVLIELRIESQFATWVLELARADDKSWPVCCGSGCEPCIQTVGHAARLLRERSTKNKDA